MKHLYYYTGYPYNIMIAAFFAFIISFQVTSGQNTKPKVSNVGTAPANYPVKARFVKTLYPGQKFDTTFYMNENKVKFIFDPSGDSKKEVWTDMYLTINYKDIDLYGFTQHGAGENQINFWQENISKDFSEIIKLNNNNFPAKLTSKLIKKNIDKSVRFEINLQI